MQIGIYIKWSNAHYHHFNASTCSSWVHLKCSHNTLPFQKGRLPLLKTPLFVWWLCNNCDSPTSKICQSITLTNICEQTPQQKNNKVRCIHQFIFSCIRNGPFVRTIISQSRRLCFLPPWTASVLQWLRLSIQHRNWINCRHPSVRPLVG